MPGKRLGFGEDLPARACWQWRRWCTSRDFNTADFGPRLPAPNWTGHARVRLHAFTDDDLSPPHCVDRVAKTYGGAADVMRNDLKDHGLELTGHLSAFLLRNKAIWPMLVQE